MVADVSKVAATLKTGTWDTVLGPISYTPKDDVTKIDFVVYRGNKDGTYSEL
jgi:branched-chain amino acid transport system substrate-binding protein